MTIDEAKRRLPLRELARSLGFETPERDGQAFRCWFADTRHANGDRKPSCNIYGERFKCHGCGAQGDGPDLLAEVLGLSEAESVREYKRRAGAGEAAPSRPEARRPKGERALWPGLRDGSNAELEALGRLRGLSPHGLALAQGMGILRFGNWCGGKAVWAVTDEGGYGAELSRMNGHTFPAFAPRDLPERKRHFAKFGEPGKRWPVGIAPRHPDAKLFRRVLLVEGSPDLLAAYHFAEALGALTWLPVAVLGRSCRIAEDALPLFVGRHVRIVPHHDDDGGGFRAAEGWGEELRRAGAGVDFYRIPEGLRTKAGKPAKDLNDAANLPERDRGRIADLFQL